MFRAAITAFCAVAAQQSLSAQEAITLPGRDGLTIKAKLYRPAGAGPFPAIVALHGCGGPWQPRDDDWGNRLAGAGFLVVFPDSFGSRGLGSQCMTRARSLRPRDRAEDAFATAEWLASRKDVARSRIGLLGWSNGGSTVLSAARTGRGPKGLEFRQAIAFYPGCRIFAEEGHYRTRLPVTILHGLADNWTPAEPCKTLPGTRFIGFERAHHDFDHPNLPLRQRKAAYTADGSGVVTVGTNPEARAAAIARVMAIFGGMRAPF
ncbi:MAG: dienelactone hydrolase family protein [Methylobacterium sp.]|nr:dienelactone hydrolase family protein [Methylobacterium sp.]MCA3601182.1 dienelactone hydrolase family protein [Methylobacterium sp.]MCA3605919.1 dienelactone hydrolase family protein [Methylobacterium sp.]MCA3609232.1 dienelactone hydrolase family protein [Methylobacterium sp.]MCA3618939.1 dienelactone hydrolase family protein [Methylobacterium sp.]